MLCDITCVILITFLHEIDYSSLKEKRSIIKSVVEKTSRKFRVSVVESGEQDSHHLGEISVGALASSTRQGDSIMDNILDYIYEISEAEIAEVEREFR